MTNFLEILKILRKIKTKNLKDFSHFFNRLKPAGTQKIFVKQNSNWKKGKGVKKLSLKSDPENTHEIHRRVVCKENS